MKSKLIVFFILFFIYGCNYKTEAQTDTTITLKDNQQQKSIIGEWHMCKSTDGSRDLLYNVCPTICFFENGSGRTQSLQKTLCNFHYVLNNEIIVITFKSLDDKEAFFATGTEFSFKLYTQNNIETLEMSQTKTNYKYILSRVK